jgi:hypothetical protein
MISGSVLEGRTRAADGGVRALGPGGGR